MKRSGACSLSLFANNHTLELITPFSHRWERIRFDLEPSSVPALASVKHRVPFLCHIRLTFPRSYMFGLDLDKDENFPASVCNAFERAPKLRSLFLHSPPTSYIFRLPYSQLSNLTIHSAGADSLFGYCHAASSIRISLCPRRLSPGRGLSLRSPLFSINSPALPSNTLTSNQCHPYRSHVAPHSKKISWHPRFASRTSVSGSSSTTTSFSTSSHTPPLSKTSH
ncbi:hypothetical protein FB451DRAFT_1211953 [Mycena latifolia]|nr:hypothetical protein FB451DRAFT_1211953 [Mycena latifolia]